MQEKLSSYRDNRLLFINFLNDLSSTESPAGDVTLLHQEVSDNNMNISS